MIYLLLLAAFVIGGIVSTEINLRLARKLERKLKIEHEKKVAKIELDAAIQFAKIYDDAESRVHGLYEKGYEEGKTGRWPELWTKKSTA